jgi:hypothetical protein
VDGIARPIQKTSENFRELEPRSQPRLRGCALAGNFKLLRGPPCLGHLEAFGGPLPSSPLLSSPFLSSQGDRAQKPAALKAEININNRFPPDQGRNQPQTHDFLVKATIQTAPGPPGGWEDKNKHKASKIQLGEYLEPASHSSYGFLATDYCKVVDARMPWALCTHRFAPPPETC